MSLRSRPLKSFVESIYQLLLKPAARHASRARGFTSENYVASAPKPLQSLLKPTCIYAPVTCRSPR